MAGLALPDAASGDKGHILTTTRRAHNAIRPAARHKVIKAIVGVREVLNGFFEGSRFVAVHTDNIGSML
jgi:hypothetical protein